MNKVLLIGNLTKTVELRFTKTGVAVANFTLAVNREIKKDDGTRDVDYLNCLLYGKQAEALSKYLEKGSKLLVEGHIQTGSYEKDGKKVYTTDIFVEKIQFLDSKK